MSANVRYDPKKNVAYLTLVDPPYRLKIHLKIDKKRGLDSRRAEVLKDVLRDIADDALVSAYLLDRKKIETINHYIAARECLNQYMSYLDDLKVYSKCKREPDGMIV